MKHHKYIGLDVHQEQYTVAIADEGRDGEVRVYGRISTDMRAVEKVMRSTCKDGSTLHVVYEAGPTGFALQRRLSQLGFECIVVAPSKTPRKASNQKTDRRDAMDLARLHRAGELTGIYIPNTSDEAIRCLSRARIDAAHDLRTAKQRLKSFLLAQGYKYQGKANWSTPHLSYLRELEMPSPVLKFTLEEYLMAISDAINRIARLEQMIEVEAPKWRMYPALKALMCIRGIQLIAATIIVSELGNIHRFSHPRHLMAYLGLVPQEDTSDNKRRLGSITKAGNSHARWILVEIIQHAFLPPKVSAQLTLRQEGQDPKYIELSWKIQTRLYTRSRHLLQRGLMKAKIQVALAREMAGFIWAMLKLVPQPSA